MNLFSLSHLSDGALLRDLAAHDAAERGATAMVLAHIAEVDARKLYLPEGYPSMHDYCVHRMRRSEQAALKRIRAARAAREFPGIFPAVADGRLHLTAVILLAPHLTPENADELLAAAAHKAMPEIERLLAERFPRRDLPTRVEAITAVQLSSRRVDVPASQLSSRTVERPAPRTKVMPLSPQKFALQVTIGQSTHDSLRYAQALLGHQVRSGDVAEVLDRALKALIVQLEKRKFAATKNPRPGRRSNSGGRYVPADVRCRVWERDCGQCTFVSEKGQRCPARTRLEFDHIVEMARGGKATVDNMRLLCRAHNQYGAECTFGAGFMNHKRQETRRKTEAARAREAERARARAAEAERESPEATAEAEARAQAAAAAEHARARANEVIPWLRALKFSADEARRAASHCEAIPDAPIEERVRVALSLFHPRSLSRGTPSREKPGTAA